MTQYYITADGTYYGGDQQSLTDTPVDQRPGKYYTYESGEWVPDEVQIEEETKKLAQEKLIKEKMREMAISELKKEGKI